MRTGVLQKTVAAGIVLIALIFLLLGGGHSYKVYQDPALEPPPDLPADGSVPPNFDLAAFGKPKSKNVTDRELVENATFTGVTRRGDALFFTYDPSQPHGKQACPT